MVLLQSLELQGCIVSHLKVLILEHLDLTKKEFDSTFSASFLHSKNPHVNNVYLVRVLSLTGIAVYEIQISKNEVKQPPVPKFGGSLAKHSRVLTF